MKIFLDTTDEVPYKVLNFLGAEVNYGGRVTDDKDIRLIKAILKRCINPDIMKVGGSFSDSGIYKTIEPGTTDDYVRYIQSLPLVPHPEAFGLHENAEITTNQQTSRTILELTLSVQARGSSGSGKSREEVIDEIAKEIQGKTPPVLPYDEITEQYPTMYNESMNTVLV